MDGHGHHALVSCAICRRSVAFVIPVFLPPRMAYESQLLRRFVAFLYTNTRDHDSTSPIFQNFPKASNLEFVQTGWKSFIEISNSMFSYVYGHISFFSHDIFVVVWLFMAMDFDSHYLSIVYVRK